MKKSKENILITRPLADDSPLWKLTADGHHITAQSFLEIIPIPLVRIPTADVYFYYSKNAVKHFLQAAQNLNVDLTNAHHTAMGKGTANILRSLDISPSFVGADSPGIVSQKLLNIYGDKSICFVRAKHSTLSVQSNWPNEYLEAIVYDTEPLRISIKDTIDTIIATSPSNLEIALQSIDTQSLKRIICIGPTTLAAAQRMTPVRCIMASTSSELAMMEAYQEC